MEKFCFPLSNMEIESITRAAGLSDFYVKEKNTPEFIRSLGKIMPCSGNALRKCFPAQGSHNRLKTDIHGNCTFLGPQGCRLDSYVRPLYCRIYPFWFSKGKLTFLKDPGCLAQQETASIKILLSLFHADPGELCTMFSTMLNNLGLETR
ncbi:MAG: YkgJ family cysteine cluster protein [Desulfonatronovibrionaceae bacterium]